MAASYLWPPGLPQVPQKGFTETGGTNVLRTPTDSGPAKLRYRGKKPNKLNLSFIMTTSQVELLENFIQNDLKGVARFSFNHPRTFLTEECRLIPQGEGELYTLSYLAPGYWSVAVQMEILP